MLRNRSIGTKVTLCMLPIITLSFFSNQFAFMFRLPMQFSQILSGLLLIAALVACMLLNHFQITRPLKKTVAMVEELSKNHIDQRLSVKSQDEIGKLSAAINGLADTLQFKLLGAMEKISRGDLDIETETDDEQDMVTPVIRDTVRNIRKISGDNKKILGLARRGILNERYEADDYQGVWAELAQEINALLDSISEPIEEVGEVMEKITVNDYTCRVNGDYQGIFGRLAKGANQVCDRLLGIQNAMMRISKGDTGVLSEGAQIEKLSENDNMVPAILKMNQSVEELILEVRRLTGESAGGNVLHARGNADKFEGGFREIVLGINGTLDAISAPIVEMSEVLDAMAVNDFTRRLSGGYKGDFKIIEEAIGKVLSSLISIQDTAVRISQGDISQLENFRKEGSRSENDRLLPAFTKMMESIRLLIWETGEIARAAAAGNLDYHIDAQAFSGEYKTIIDAFSEAFEEMARPLREVSGVMDSMSKGKMDVKVGGRYQGEFQRLAESVNLTARGIHSIVNELSDALLKMSEGNFDLMPLQKFQGDYSDISDAINKILSTLNGLLGQINITAEQVSAGSFQVSQGSQSLSAGSTEQASAVEELTASVSQMAGQTKKNAENAGSARRLVSQVKNSATDGGKRMDEMLRSMNEIGEASSNISKIIKVIDDIAFQTNILSLNAAVEAARAGQYGKGFAVVAEEVRNLAARSAQAARETTELIESTARKVGEGTVTAGKTASAFDSIVDGVKKVSDMVEAISESSGGQATGITQIEQGLTQVSRVIQINSATAEQSAAASEELSSQADLLKDQVLKFSLREKKAR